MQREQPLFSFKSQMTVKTNMYITVKCYNFNTMNILLLKISKNVANHFEISRLNTDCTHSYIVADLYQVIVKITPTVGN